MVAQRLLILIVFSVFLSGCGDTENNRISPGPKAVVDGFVQNDYQQSIEGAGDRFVKGLSAVYQESGDEAVVVSVVCVDYKDKMIETFSGPPLVTILEKSGQEWLIKEGPIDSIPNSLKKDRPGIQILGEKLQKKMPKECLSDLFG